jgi:hypothetical protein
VGRIIETLESLGKLDRTLILFPSDISVVLYWAMCFLLMIVFMLVFSVFVWAIIRKILSLLIVVEYLTFSPF